MNKLVQVIYVSSVAPDITEHDTLKFLKQARTANRKHDVSGMMLYIDGWFLQLLEGHGAMVDVVCSTIFRDKREMRMILREFIAEREFPDWTMGFEAVKPAEACRLLGKPQLFDSVATFADMDPDSAKSLLSIIGRRRWQADRSGMFHAIRAAGSREL